MAAVQVAPGQLVLVELDQHAFGDGLGQQVAAFLVTAVEHAQTAGLAQLHTLGQPLLHVRIEGQSRQVRLQIRHASPFAKIISGGSQMGGFYARLGKTFKSQVLGHCHMYNS